MRLVSDTTPTVTVIIGVLVILLAGSGIASGVQVSGAGLGTSPSASQTDSPENDTANVTFRDQLILFRAQQVFINNVSLPAGGFVVLVDESGTRRGATTLLEPGKHAGLNISLSRPACTATNLTAVVYRDDGNGHLDAEDLPYNWGEGPVQSAATLYPTGAALYDMSNQSITDGSVTIDRARVTDGGGFVIVANATGSTVTEPLSPDRFNRLGHSGYLTSGDGNKISVPLDKSTDGNITVVAYTITDTNSNRRFDAADAPSGPLCRNIGYASATLTVEPKTPSSTPSGDQPEVPNGSNSSSTRSSAVGQHGFGLVTSALAGILLWVMVRN